MLVEKLHARIRTELERVGRDRAQIRNSLRWTLFSLEMSVGREEFAEEYRSWLLAAWEVALLQVLDEAVAEEEYEWAGECQLMLSECQFSGEEVY